MTPLPQYLPEVVALGRVGFAGYVLSRLPRDLWRAVLDRLTDGRPLARWEWAELERWAR